MKQIRHGVFETNSSSTHSLVIGNLSEEQSSWEYKFPNISVRPVHFGYDDIVAPSEFSNAFPEMDELCGDCEYLECKKSNYGNWSDINCKNKEYEETRSYGDRTWTYNFYEEKCKRYIDAKTKTMKKIIDNQSPDDRASALLTCIVYYCSNTAETIKMYFDKLFDICEKVYYKGKEFTREENVIAYWSGAIDSGWGDYDSPCWMETHDSSLETADVEKVLSTTESVKSYIFGNGSYAMGDRNG